jgi:recombination protein RecA
MGALDVTVPGYVSTQSLAIDWIVGNGGLPQTRIIDVTSDEGCGKSTLGDHVLAEVQRIGGHAYLWDTENARDATYQEKIGLVRKRAVEIDAHTMEDGFEAMIAILRFHLEHDPQRPGVIVWDTPAGTPTRNEVDADAKAERFGPAKIIRSQLRQLNQILQQTRWILFIANQTYMGQQAHGLVKTAYGGGGIPYYASVRLQLSHPSKFWAKTAHKDLNLPPMGQTVWCKCIKNRVDMPYRSRQIAIHFGEGISNTFEIFSLMKLTGALVQSGSWYRFAEDTAPELVELGSFQGTHLYLDALIQERPELWAVLIDVYHRCNERLVSQ